MPKRERQRPERPEAGRPNKVAGAIIVAQHTNKPLPYPIPDFDVAWHSPNTETQRSAIWMWVFQPPHTLASKAAQRAISNLEYQRRYGHQKLRKANEFNTDGHFPHWLRGMTALTKSALEIRHASLVDLCLDWWSQQLWLMQTMLCPDGRIVGTGMRFEGGWREERDIAYALLVGTPHRRLKGEKFWRNAENSQDTFGLHLLRGLVDKGVFSGLVASPPLSASNYSIERYEHGHVTRSDWLPTTWVDYDTGQIGTSDDGDGEDVPDLGAEKESWALRVAPESPLSDD